MEQRKAQRFDLRLPFELVRSGTQALSEHGETQELELSRRALPLRRDL